MNRVDITKIEGANVGKNSYIECDEFLCEGNFTLGDNVEIIAKKVYLGNNSNIEAGVKVKAIKGVMDLFFIGDETLIGYNCQVKVPIFKMGDYTRIFNSSLFNGYKPLVIGHNCWIGQTSVLNSAEDLTIGNNVRMGSVQIWTHVASGELLEGCRFHSEKPVTIKDNVWLMGFGHTVSPGVTIERNTIVMAGSVVSKSTLPFHTYSGIPAEDITDKLNGWDMPTIDEKFEMLKKFVDEFTVEFPYLSQSVLCLENEEDSKQYFDNENPCIIFIKNVSEMNKYGDSIHTIFDLNTKTYWKRRTKAEVCWMKFSTGYRARFLPINS